MIPLSGSINILSSVTLSAGNISGTLTGTIHRTNYSPKLLIVTTTPLVALDGIRTSAGLFLNNTTNFPAGCRVIDQRSPVGFAYSGVSFSSGTCTLSVATMPFASVSGQTFYVSGAANPALNGTYVTNAIGSTTTFVFALAADPTTGFIGCTVTPGIVNSAAGTGSGCVGYYTLSMNILADVSNASLSTTTRTPTLIANSTNYIIATATTSTNAMGDVILDGIGTVPITCNDIVNIKNFKSGVYIMANGSAATDIAKLTFVNYNPFGSN